MTEQQRYDAEDISILEGLEGIRRRPGMYIGGTHIRALHHLINEIISNSVDEAQMGACSAIWVRLLPGGVIEVQDNGRGIPVAEHPEKGISALELVMTTTHSGGKLDDDDTTSYEYSGGLHGVGLAAVNALSEETVVTVERDGYIWKQSYSEGLPTSDVERGKKSKRTGTTIRFKFDPTIFEAVGAEPYSFDTVADMVRNAAMQVSGLYCELRDTRGDMQRVGYRFENGIWENVARKVQDAQRQTKVVDFKVEIEDGSGRPAYVSAAMCWTLDREEIITYANGIHTAEGGTHETGLKTAISRGVIEACKSARKRGAGSVKGSDVRMGLVAVMSILLSEPQFEGQTKNKLANIDVRTSVFSALYQAIAEEFEQDSHFHKAVISLAIDAQKRRRRAAKAKERRKKLEKKAEFGVLPGKLSDISSNNEGKTTELFIVEGDSAGGSAKMARDRTFQAILPLRGKILNSVKASPSRVRRNSTIQDIAVAVGIDDEEARYDRIIFLTDADPDGAHIRALLTAYFVMHRTDLVRAGRLYAAQPPLYKVTHDGSEEYIYTEGEMDRLRKELKGQKYEVARYKGLGEMNPEQLWATTMNPDNRYLLKITVDDYKATKELLNELMGRSVAGRREFIKDVADEELNYDFI